MRLCEYLDSMADRTEAEEVSGIGSFVDGERNPEDSVDPGRWTCRKVGGKYLCYWDGKVLDLTSLVARLRDLYSSKGHAGQGMSKLGEEGLAKYATVRSVLKDCMGRCMSRTVDPGQAAEWVWNWEGLDGTV